VSPGDLATGGTPDVWPSSGKQPMMRQARRT
jgi:hypothetical protein